MSDLFADEIARWMFFISGVALLVAVFLLPAAADLREVRQIRDQALASETHHLDRVARYTSFLDAVRAQNPSTIELLAQSQLGVIPSDRDALIVPGKPTDPMVFELLEPEPQQVVAAAVNSSRLERLTTSPRSRVFVIAIGFAAALFGLLRPAIRVRPTPKADGRSVLRLQGSRV